MIPVVRDDILSCLTGIPAVLWTLHKLHPAITRKKFDPGKTRSPFYTAGIPLCRNEIFPCSRFSPRNQEEKVNQKISTEVHFNRSKIFLLCFYDAYDVICEKKVNKCPCGISSFYRSIQRRYSAKKVFLKILQYSQKNTFVGVSLQAFRFAILLTRDTSSYVHCIKN